MIITGKGGQILGTYMFGPAFLRPDQRHLLVDLAEADGSRGEVHAGRHPIGASDIGF